MNKKYTKSFLATVISLSLLASTAQAGFANKAARFAFNGTAVAGSAWIAWYLHTPAWNSLKELKDIKGSDAKLALLKNALFTIVGYTALTKAFVSGAKGLLDTFNTDVINEDEE